MKKWILGAAALLGCKSEKDFPPLVLAPHVDISRYMGTWYVIGNIPNFFEKDLVASTETYSPGKEPGDIDIKFQGRVKTFDGKIKTIPQTAKVLDMNVGSEWKVRIFFWLRVPYLIMDVDPEYQWTLVGYPDRSLIWIMARTPTMNEALYASLLEKAKLQGYDISKIVKIPQIIP